MSKSMNLMFRSTLLLLVMLLFVACSKRDLPIFDYLKPQRTCVVESMNEENQASDDFFLVKTFNEHGLLTHFKTQLRDIHPTTYVWDYEIIYSPHKATFKGVTKTYNWYNIDPEDENSPLYAEEQVDLRETRDIEISFDPKTRKPLKARYVLSTEIILEMSYDARGFLSKVGEYDVTTDSRGNIESITTPPYEGEYYHGQQLGVWYGYSEDSSRKGRQFYEAPNVVINPLYSILEILDWGGLQPDRERTALFIQYAYADEYLPVQPALDVMYSDHQYDSEGKLLQYTFAGNFYEALPYSYTGRLLSRSIKWSCGDAYVKPAPKP
jgi:hypothetical protein